MKKKGLKLGIRIGAAVLCLAMVAAIVLAALPNPVHAATSLNQIENIKNNKPVFTILEIVPQAGAGSIGYYVDGQEPIANWKNELSAISGSANRQEKFNERINSLKSQGLIGDLADPDGSKFPLTVVGNYAEYLPWEEIPAGAQPIQLDQPEQVTVTGTFQSVGVGKGDFSSVTKSILETGGGYVQNVLYYEHGAEEGAYYYALEFEQISILTDEDAKAYFNKPLYRIYDGEYSYEGTLTESGGFRVELGGEPYYIVKSASVPSSTYDEASGTVYRAVCSETEPFILAPDGVGYFRIEIISYQYVGENQGGYALQRGEGDVIALVSCDQIYITGEFENNNWLKRYVFDIDDPETNDMQIRVISLTPDQSAGITTQIAAADMIVLTAPAGTGYTADITAEQSAAIQAQTAVLKPVVVDTRLKNCGQDRLAALANALTGENPGVSGSVYCFERDALRLELATNQFHEPFEDAVSTQKYSQVLKEIEYENFLRSNQDEDIALLSTQITVGSCIRAIISRQGQRVENHKSSIKVLDIEPSGANSTGALTVADVQSWLPSGTLRNDQITIVTMSTAEFIGKIEDITEEYDLIYIGANTKGFNLSNGQTVYNDTKMNGLIYSNIGDTVTANYMLSGLLDRDYSDSTFKSGSTTYYKLQANTANQFRFSGNDITASKGQELENFINSGRPVIVADELLTVVQAVGERQLSVTVTGSARTSNGKTTVTLTATPSEAVDSLAYQWYKNGKLLDNKIDATLSLTASTTNGDNYVKTGDTFYCVVTAGTDDGDRTATSNTVTCKQEEVLTFDRDTVTVTEILEPWITITYSNGAAKANLPNEWRNVSYQWQYRNNNGSWINVSNNGKDASYSLSRSSYTYRCVVTRNGTKYYSQSVKRNNNSSATVTNEADTSAKTSATLTVTRDGNVLTAAVSCPSGWSAGSLQWYRYTTNADGGAINGATQLSHTVTQTGNYYFRVQLKKNNSQTTKNLSNESQKFAVTNQTSWVVESTAVGQSATLPAVEGGATVNSARIDNSSLLYGTLTGVITEPNVLPVRFAKEQQDTVLRHLNLSKPEIVKSTSGVWPVEYQSIDDLQTSLVTNRTLAYEFTIENPTDVTPETTRYTCKLYIDLNADGRYVENEEISDLTILALPNSQRVENGTLQLGTTYRVLRTLSDQHTGVISWKLVVEKVDETVPAEERVHASQKGYTYIKPETATKIHVLQVWDDDQVLLNEGVYKTLYDQLRAANAFDVTVTTMHTGEFNTTIAGWIDEAEEAELDPDEYVAQQLNEYNMLLLGFGDAYSSQNGDLEDDTANAIFRFIESGKAVLFTHDNTSTVNLPVNNYQSTQSGQQANHDSAYYWGYSFNTIVRDAVGLDRYGVTNKTFGGTTAATAGSSGKGSLVASGYKNADASQLQQLLNSHYSVAYEPKSNGTATVGETQGFTNFILVHHKNSGQKNPAGYTDNSSNRETKEVTQTNQGQITQFPFPVEQTLTVMSTHEQYYQLNMNDEEVVVWYCLGGSNYSNTKNDASNGYYIYNKGNVTYSGAGHIAKSSSGWGWGWGGSGTTNAVVESEAKLFVNTMIAAYRAGNGNPSVEFKTADGKAKQEILLLPTDYKADGFSPVVQDTKPVLYFSVEDPNLSASKIVTVEFYREDAVNGTGDPELGDSKVSRITVGNIIRTDTGTVASGSLASKMLYQVELPQEVLDEMGNIDDDEKLTVYVKVITNINGTRYTGYSTVELAKMGLLAIH